VSTVKKSHANIGFARAQQNSLHDGPVRRRAGFSPALCTMFQTVAAATT
jgi:hypothetical protein